MVMTNGSCAVVTATDSRRLCRVGNGQKSNYAIRYEVVKRNKGTRLQLSKR